MTAYRYVGKGVYTVSDVARISGVETANLRRWVDGYFYQDRLGNRRRVTPVFARDLERIDETTVLTFLDLVEVVFIRAFRSKGVGLRTIRLASRRAAEILKSPHPFATKRFYTDGRHILAEIAKKDGAPDIVELVSRQYEIDDIIRPLLHEGLDFDNFDLAHRYWPLGKKRSVVVDPERSFGKPILAESGVPTEIIADDFKQGRSPHEIAWWYEIPEASVNDALRFENLVAA